MESVWKKKNIFWADKDMPVGIITSLKMSLNIKYIFKLASKRGTNTTRNYWSSNIKHIVWRKKYHDS